MVVFVLWVSSASEYAPANLIYVASASGTIYIRADGSVDPPTAPISSVDNVTYTFTDNILDGIVVERDDVVVDGAGYTVQGTGSGTGIDLSFRNNVTLKNVEVTGFHIGIWLESSGNNVLAGNTASSNNRYGILLNSSNNNTLTGNIASNTDRGIYLGSSDNNALTDNNASNNYAGIELFDSDCNNLVGNNASNNNDGILLSSSNNNVLAGNTASNNDMGIYLRVSSKYNVLIGNTASSNNNNGILLNSSNNNTLTGNNASDNNHGIHLSYSSNNNLTGNNVSNKGEGIELFSSSHNTLTGNNASKNMIGIHLFSSSNNTLTGNNVSNNTWSGIYFGIYTSPSSNNILFHNNLINNTQQVYIQSSGYANVWDDGYPSGGNYWSNYTGVDENRGPNQDQLGSDGIGDTPYTINSDNVDRYPLMNLWPTPAREITLEVSAGWNMVSLPVLPDDPVASSVLSGLGFYQLVTWSGTGYFTATEFEAGRGYWLLVLEETNITISGTPVVWLNLTLSPGWSMIGGPYFSVQAADVFPGFYQFVTWTGTGYTPATVFEPGKGFWALVLEETQIQLPPT